MGASTTVARSVPFIALLFRNELFRSLLSRAHGNWHIESGYPTQANRRLEWGTQHLLQVWQRSKSAAHLFLSSLRFQFLRYLNVPTRCANFKHKKKVKKQCQQSTSL